MIHSMPRSVLNSEPFTFALLAIGVLVVIAVSGPASALGIPLMALGWWCWFTAYESTGAAASLLDRQRRLPWIAISSIFLITGALGIHLRLAPGLPSLVVLLVGASVWCLIPSHRGLVVESESRGGWTSLVLVGGLNRWAALTLVSRTVDAGLTDGGMLLDSAERLVECLIVASGIACACSLGRLWHGRKRQEPQHWIVCVIQLETAIVLAAISASAWSRTSSTSGHFELLLPGIDQLPAALIAWDSLLTAVLCTCNLWESRERHRQVVAYIIVIALLDLAGVPPLPGFWFKWWTLAACLYPYHLEPFAGMFDVHEGFRLLALLLVFGQSCVTIRLLTWLALRVSVPPPHVKNLSVDQRNDFESSLASVGHE
jgi:hypothetical protein